MSARSRLKIADRTIERATWRGDPPLVKVCDRQLRYRGATVPLLAANDSLAAHMAEKRAGQAARKFPRSRSSQRGFILMPYQSGDSSFSQVVWLVDMDGSNNGTTFTDLSSYARAFTAQSTGKTVTATKKFGTASMQAGGGYIDTPDNANLTIGSSAFCVEGWFYQPSTWGATQWITGQSKSDGSNANFSYGVNTSSTPRLVGTVGNGSGTKDITGTSGFSFATWYWFALCRTGNTMYLLTDNVQEGTVDVTGVTINDSAFKLAIGQFGERTVGPWNGNVDESRMTIGAGRYSGAVAAPTTIFPRS